MVPRPSSVLPRTMAWFSIPPQFPTIEMRAPGVNFWLQVDALGRRFKRRTGHLTHPSSPTGNDTSTTLR